MRNIVKTLMQKEKQLSKIMRALEMPLKANLEILNTQVQPKS